MDHNRQRGAIRLSWASKNISSHKPTRRQSLSWAFQRGRKLGSVT